MPEVLTFIAENNIGFLESRESFLGALADNLGYSLRVVATATTIENALSAIEATDWPFYLASLDANLRNGDYSGDHGKQMLDLLRSLRPRTVVIGYAAEPFPRTELGNTVDFDFNSRSGLDFDIKIGLLGQAFTMAVASAAK